jgi:hypothetical protein
MPVQAPDLRSALAHLRLSWPVNEEVLRVAYRRLALAHHPDRGGSHAEFVRVQHSYETILAAVRNNAPPGASSWRQEKGEGADDADEGFQNFIDGFGRSRRGNLWRVWRGRNLTVHTGRRGGYSYCVGSDDEGPRFAGRWFRTEAEAMWALWRAVGEEDW